MEIRDRILGNGQATAAKNGRKRSLESFSADTLLKAKLPQPRWLADGLVVEGGLTLLAGAPKAGKSFLLMNLALAVAQGDLFLGKQCDKRTVLYLCLEDGPLRTQNRLRKMVVLPDPVGELFFVFDCPRLDKGGMAGLDEELRHLGDEIGLMVIDTWGMLCPEQIARQGYQTDLENVNLLRHFSNAYHIATVANLHTRKMPAEDFLHRVTGSVGITAAADSVWVLSRQRGQKVAQLEITSRDYEEMELALQFDGQSFCWENLGPAGEHREAASQVLVMELFARKDTWSVADLAMELDATTRSVRALLYRLSEQGKITPCAKGFYTTRALDT